MEKDKRSYNTNLTVMTRQFLVPGWPKILLYLLIGMLLLMIWNSRRLWDQLNRNILEVTSPSLSVFTSPRTNWIEKAYNGIFTGRAAQVVFWAFAGCAVYVCIWFIVNIFSNIRNDLIAGDYVHAGKYNRSGYWHSIIARKVFLVAVSVLLLTFVISGLRLMGLLAKFFYSSLQDFSPSPNIVEICAAIVGASILVYIFVLLTHITVNSWRAVYSDL